MIFIFTITIIGPIETGKTQSKKKEKKKRNICMFSALYFVPCLFYSNYKKGKIYNNNHKKETGESELRNITTGKQTITTQHEYLLTARNERYKNEKMKKISA